MAVGPNLNGPISRPSPRTTDRHPPAPNVTWPSSCHDGPRDGRDPDGPLTPRSLRSLTPPTPQAPPAPRRRSTPTTPPGISHQFSQRRLHTRRQLPLTRVLILLYGLHGGPFVSVASSQLATGSTRPDEARGTARLKIHKAGGQPRRRILGERDLPRRRAVHTSAASTFHYDRAASHATRVTPLTCPPARGRGGRARSAC